MAATDPHQGSEGGGGTAPADAPIPPVNAWPTASFRDGEDEDEDEWEYEYSNTETEVCISFSHFPPSPTLLLATPANRVLPRRTTCQSTSPFHSSPSVKDPYARRHGVVISTGIGLVPPFKSDLR